MRSVFFPHSLHTNSIDNYPHVYTKMWISFSCNLGEDLTRKATTKSARESFFNFFDIGDQFGIGGGQIRRNFIACMNHRRVVFTPEDLADLRKGHADHISAEVHRNLSGNDDIFASSGRKNVTDGDIVES